MDNPQSIITQVPRDDDSLHMSMPSIVEKVPKKLKTRNFFRKLFCCIQPQNGGYVGQQHTFSPTQTSLLPLTLTDDIISTKTVTESFLLEEQSEADRSKKCVVIDLDETLVHSSFAPVQNADFIIPVEIDDTVHQVYVLKRPFVDEFLEKMGQLFECVLFTASLGKYADPVTDLLDKTGVFRARLFRESCVFHCGSYVKDLSRLGRDLSKVAILDNSPASYLFHPRNAVSVTSWFDNPLDRELLNLIPFFEDLATSPDVYTILDSINMRAITPLSEKRASTPVVDKNDEGTPQNEATVEGEKM